jgi:alpha-galactosidase
MRTLRAHNIIFLLIILSTIAFCSNNNQDNIKTSFFSVSWTKSSVRSWKYTIYPDRKSIDVMLPVFEIDGKQTPIVLDRLTSVKSPKTLRNGVTEYTYRGTFQKDTSLHLLVTFRVSNDNPVVRFFYTLKASNKQKLTKQTGRDNLIYVSSSFKRFPEAKEIRLSVFNEMIHSCNLTEARLYEPDFENSASLVGPILLGSNDQQTILFAYEHDSMYPNNFVEYRLHSDRSVELCAVKGNYYGDQLADTYSTIWFELCGIEGNEESLASLYRTFMLKYISENTESRKPYIYYNTWGRQERIKWAGAQYLTSMNLDYTLQEIDRAHEMGIEIYEFDAGWFDKTGDWGVNLKNFPDGFKKVREKIEGYGMKIGVWMDPAKAAVSSVALVENNNCLKTWNGKPGTPSPEWETEESTNMCLVSPYWEHYAEVLIRMNKELGISYFYLDGTGQSGCNDSTHFHGTMANKPEERGQCYGFLMPVYLGKIIDKVTAACPDVIFDFDVTESGRIGVGLQFLASGRYFILNNGPYFRNFDLGESLLPNGNHNIFIHPGPARTWFIRSVLDYDKWIPSELFLANYQPDDPENSQIINLASLILGQNSIWGELLKTSPEGVALFHNILGKYKQIRDDVAIASPIRVGNPGDTPEIYEKINPETGKGVVVIFANSKGKYSYITKNKVINSFWTIDGTKVSVTKDNHARIEAVFEKASASIILFGVKDRL